MNIKAKIGLTLKKGLYILQILIIMTSSLTQSSSMNYCSSIFESLYGNRNRNRVLLFL